MKGTFAVAATAALAGAASASAHRRHAHDLFHGLEKKDATCVPGCTTIYSTWYGEATRTSTTITTRTTLQVGIAR